MGKSQRIVFVHNAAWYNNDVQIKIVYLKNNMTDKNSKSRAELLADLDAALVLANQLVKSVEKAFPQAAADYVPIDFSKMSTEEKLKLGEEQARQLSEIAFKINAEATAKTIARDAINKAKSNVER